jgi:hypothetical protein
MRPHFSEEVWTGLVSAYAFLSGESGGPLAGLLYERTLPTVHREALRLCLMYGISMSDDPLAVMEMLSLGGTGIPKPELNRLWAVLVAEGETGFSHGTPSGHPWRVLTDPPDRYPELSHLLYLMKSA